MSIFWHIKIRERDFSPKRPLKIKMPFRQMVVDSENGVYEYINDGKGKIHYTFIYTLIEEK